MRALLVLLFVLSASAAFAVEVDGTAAKVGADTILRSDVMNEMRRRGESGAKAYEEVRNDLIDRRLIIQASAEAKMTIQEWVVDNRVREIIAKSFDGDRNKLIETLGRQKQAYPEWRARIKEDMVVGAMRWNAVDKNAVASPTAMRREYEEHPERYATEHKVSVTVIMLKPDEAAKRDEISAKVKDVDFVALGGRKYEGVVPEEAFNAEVCKEIAKMPKGTISRWLEIDGWSFLIRKDGETTGKQLSFEEAYEQVEANVKEADAKRLYLAWIERLRAETYIKVF